MKKLNSFCKIFFIILFCKFSTSLNGALDSKHWYEKYIPSFILEKRLPTMPSIANLQNATIPLFTQLSQSLISVLSEVKKDILRNLLSTETSPVNTNPSRQEFENPTKEPINEAPKEYKPQDSIEIETDTSQINTNPSKQQFKNPTEELINEAPKGYKPKVYTIDHIKEVQIPIILEEAIEIEKNNEKKNIMLEDYIKATFYFLAYTKIGFPQYDFSKGTWVRDYKDIFNRSKTSTLNTVLSKKLIVNNIKDPLQVANNILDKIVADFNKKSITSEEEFKSFLESYRITVGEFQKKYQDYESVEKVLSRWKVF